jgi:hypothetical protein
MTMEFAGTWFADKDDRITCSEVPIRNNEVGNILVHFGPDFRMALTESQAEVLICQVSAKLTEIKRRPSLPVPAEAATGCTVDADDLMASIVEIDREAC